MKKKSLALEPTVYDGATTWRHWTRLMRVLKAEGKNVGSYKASWWRWTFLLVAVPTRHDAGKNLMSVVEYVI